MAVTMLTYQKIWRDQLLLGERGSVKLGGTAVNNFDHWKFASSSDDLLVKSSSYNTNNIYGFGHPVFYKDIINTLRGIETDICKGKDGLKSLEIIIAAYKSASKGKTIKLPID